MCVQSAVGEPRTGVRGCGPVAASAPARVFSLALAEGCFLNHRGHRVHRGRAGLVVRFVCAAGPRGKSISYVYRVLWASRGRESAGAAPVWRTQVKPRMIEREKCSARLHRTGVFFEPRRAQRSQRPGASGGENFVTPSRSGKSIRCVYRVLWASRGRESAGAASVCRTQTQLRSTGHEPRS